MRREACFLLLIEASSSVIINEYAISATAMLHITLALIMRPCLWLGCEVRAMRVRL